MRKRLFLYTLLIIVGAFLATILFDAKQKNNVEIKVDGNDYSVSSSSDVFLESGLFTQVDDMTIYNQGEVDQTDFSKKLENSELALFVNDDNGSIRVVKKDTGYVWASDIIDEEDDEITNAIYKIAESAFTVKYLTADNAIKEFYAIDSKTKITSSVSGNKISFKVNNSNLKISFNYSITLIDNKIDVELDASSIKEDGDNKISSITMYPYLGSEHKQDIPGYIFYPSEAGALIRYNKVPTITSSSVSKFYGTDANITRQQEDEVLSLPIYGVVHGIEQNGMLVEVKDGTGFATLTYSPSTVKENINFNLIYPSFNYREQYIISIPGASSVLVVPSECYKTNANIEYTFLSGTDASYFGFAKTYQKTLENRGVLTKKNDYTSDIGIQIEAFGRDYTKGLIFNEYHNMTTTKDILSINEYLTSNNVKNLMYTLRAFNRGGYSKQSVSNYSFDSKLGSLHDLDDLEYYFYYNPVESYSKKKQFPNQVLVNLYNEKSFIQISENKYKFYANVKAILKYTIQAVEKYDSRIALDGIGYRLYGDKNNKYSRTDTLNSYSELLGSNKVAMYKPNYYFLENTSSYLNMNLYSSRFRFVSDSVPFLQILLNGYMDYYSPFLNFSSNIELDVLKCVEFGCNPAYLVTNLHSYLLSDALSSNYYATYFEAIEELIVSEYNYINTALKEVRGSSMTSRQVLKAGVVVVSYSNGKKIIVNYTNSDYIYGGSVVKGMDYKVL